MPAAILFSFVRVPRRLKRENMASFPAELTPEPEERPAARRP